MQITRYGEVVSDATYRLNVIRAERKKKHFDVFASFDDEGDEFKAQRIDIYPIKVCFKASLSHWIMNAF